VFIVTFPCGPDSLVAELCQRRIEGIPIVTLVIDELDAESGLRTRLESFVDIIDAKRRAAALCEACS
jgi:predicted nucleotide-binding protein (sugar kinase/HSP70/actin superfamily)